MIVPWPPSVNNYWILVRMGKGGRKILSKRAVAYREEMHQIITTQYPDIKFTEDKRLKLYIDAYPPDLRKRDLDNILKPLQDALQNEGVLIDDSQIDDLRIKRQEVRRPKGELNITLEEI